MQQPTSSDQMIQYRVAAEHRLHFGRLFFQVTAFNLSFALALFAITSGYVGGRRAVGLSGMLLMVSGFVAGRLLRQESRYAGAMASIERSQGALLIVEPPPAGGARLMTVIGLIVVGVALVGSTVLLG